MEQYDLERRFHELESRVLALENALGLRGSNTRSAETPAQAGVDIVVLNKRVHSANPMSGTYMDSVHFDARFELTGTPKTARAVKGQFEFCDLFGDPQFSVTFTLSDALSTGRPVLVKDISFDLNEFMADHKWVASTPLNDMVCRFRTDRIMFADGSTI